jgi:hypothetical protein
MRVRIFSHNILIPFSNLDSWAAAWCFVSGTIRVANLRPARTTTGYGVVWLGTGLTSQSVLVPRMKNPRSFVIVLFFWSRYKYSYVKKNQFSYFSYKIFIWPSIFYISLVLELNLHVTSHYTDTLNFKSIYIEH